MWKKFVLVFAVLIAVFLLWDVFKRAPQEPAKKVELPVAQTGEKLYVNEYYGFAFVYPESWTLTYAGSQEDENMAQSLTLTGADKIKAELFAVDVSRLLAGNRALAEFDTAAEWLKWQREKNPPAGEYNDEEINFGGRRLAVRTRYQTSGNGESKQTIAVLDPYSNYLFTIKLAGGGESDEAAFDRLVSSFVFTR